MQGNCQKKSEKEGLARELSSEELETSIIGGVEVGIGIGSGMEEEGSEVNIFGNIPNIDRIISKGSGVY